MKTASSFNPKPAAQANRRPADFFERCWALIRWMSPDLARAVTLCEGLTTSHERSTAGLLFVVLAFERSPPDENEKKSKRN